MKPKVPSNYAAPAGLLSADQAGFHERLNQLVDFKVLKGMILEVDDIPAEYLEPRIRYDCGFLDEKTLHRFANDGESDITREFLQAALERGDRCYGFMDEGRLAAYGWYSMRPTTISDTLKLYFDPNYVYMYKGFTHPSYRGKRLHGIGMAKAVEALTREGRKGLISYVEYHNRPSLRSCHRLGYRIFGSVFIIGSRGHYLTWRTPRCRQFKFNVALA